MIIYIASPYSHPDKQVEQWRYERTQEEVAAMCRAGHYAYSPIVHCHPMAQLHDLPTDAAWWQSRNEAFIRKCDKLVVLMLEDWDRSIGVRHEIAFAEQHGIPVEYLTPGQTLEVAA